MTPEDVKRFYDAFSKSRMLDYRISGGNLRLEKAWRRVAATVRRGETLLDLGCGIGLVAEAVARAHRGRVRVWGCDISPQNIWYAARTVDARHIGFFEADIIRDFDKVAATAGKVDVVALVDVIEHIPLEEHRRVFALISEVARPGARAVLTYPSPEYQAYLRENNPAELQIIDECVDIASLVEIAEENGFRLKHYSLEDVWMENQYVHAVFQRDLAVRPRITPPLGVRARTRSMLGKATSAVLVPYRRWKYVSRALRSDA
jgi:SAM-dependent methyltransferase